MLSFEQWDAEFAKAEQMQRVRPASTDKPLLNPHRGTTTFQRFEGDALQADHSWHDELGPEKFEPPKPQAPYVGLYPATRVTYCRWPWSVLEPREGEIRFDLIHNSLKAAQERGQSLQIRFEPYVLDDIPKWYVALGGKVIPQSGGMPGPDIDSNDPLYLKHWRRFTAALGGEFNGHANLDSVDVAYAGRFGEMGGNATPESAAQLVDAYAEGFPETHLLSMIGTLGAAHAAKSGYRQFGWRGDGFLDVKYRAKGVVPDGLVWHHMYDEYPRHLNEQGLRDAWMHAPVSLEPYQTVWHLLKAEGFSRDIRWQLDQCLKYHPSTFMAKSVEIPAEYWDAYLEFENKLGYRFFVHQLMLPREVKPEQGFKAPLTIDNRGIAPIYKRYDFALRFVQGEQSALVRFKANVRAWLPGFSFVQEELRVPESLKPGPARVDCALVDSSGKACVKFAHAEILDDGWHPITHVRVLGA